MAGAAIPFEPATPRTPTPAAGAAESSTADDAESAAPRNAPAAEATTLGAATSIAGAAVCEAGSVPVDAAFASAVLRSEVLGTEVVTLPATLGAAAPGLAVVLPVRGAAPAAGGIAIWTAVRVVSVEGGAAAKVACVAEEPAAAVAFCATPVPGAATATGTAPFATLSPVGAAPRPASPTGSPRAWANPAPGLACMAGADLSEIGGPLSGFGPAAGAAVFEVAAVAGVVPGAAVPPTRPDSPVITPAAPVTAPAATVAAVAAFAAAIAGAAAAASAGGGAETGVGGGAELPGTGKGPPPARSPWALPAGGLRACLGPALLSAAAKSWPPPESGELAGPALSAAAAPLFTVGCETLGMAFIPIDVARGMPKPAAKAARSLD